MAPGANVADLSFAGYSPETGEWGYSAAEGPSASRSRLRYCPMGSLEGY